MLFSRLSGGGRRHVLRAALLALTVLVIAPVAAHASASWSAPVAVDSAQLQSVSCPSASRCVAVDARGDAVAYDGDNWSAPTGIDSPNQLNSVSCPSASFCVAVDFDGNAVTFDGVGWSAPVAIDPGNSLSAVSCPSASFCVAVDTSGSALIYRDGAWSAPASVDPGHSFSAVSCASASFCAAVDTTGSALIYRDGAWSAPASVDPGHSFSAVSCASMSFCLAVEANAYYATFDAGIWSAAQPMVIEQLTSVSCPTVSFCTAVNDGNGWAPTYDGGDWTGGLQASAEPDGQLRAVSCASSSFCVAVDNAGNAVVYGIPPPSPPPSPPPPPLPPAAPSIPMISSSPVISGSPVAGAILTEAHGSWTNEPDSFSYRWQRCSATGGDCSAIPEATSQAYVISASDVGHRLRVQELASNSSGAGAPGVSAPTAVVTSEATALAGAIVPRDRAVTIRQLVRRGGQRVTFHAPTAGHLELSWYVDPPGGRRRQREVIAKLSLRIPAGTVEMMLKLTPSYRYHLLVHSHHIEVVATGTFTPIGKKPITVTKRFKLKA